MKPKSTLRSFLAIAGSSLLAVTYVSAAPETYYWDSNDSTGYFGTTAGTWTGTTTGTATRGWSTDPLGATVVNGNSITTDVEDDIFFGRGVNLRNVATITGDATVTCESTTGLEMGMTVVGTGITVGTTVLSITSPTEFELSANATATQIVIQWGANFPYTGTTTITGPVSAKSIYQSTSHPNFAGASQTINFAAVGSYESASANRAFAATTTLGGAATSMTWKVPYSNSCNITGITTNNAGQNIIQGPGRLGVTTMANLGVAGQGVVFKGGVLRFVNNFPCDTYPSVTAFNAVHPISFTVNEDAGFDNQNSNALRQTFTVDVPLTLGTGGFSVEGNGGANFILTNTGNNYTGATLLLGANLQISEAAHIGDSTAPFYFNGNLKITGNTMTTLGTRSVVIRGGSTMKLNIDDASNVFTVGQTLTDNVAGDGYALGAWQDIAGVCGVAKSGAGTLVLSGSSNTYTGTTVVSGGTLIMSGNNALTGAITATGASGATLTLSGNNSGMTSSVTLSTSFPTTAGSSPLLNINSATALGTGTLTFGGGAASDTVRIDNTSAGAVTVGTANAITMNRDFTFIGTQDLNLGTGAITLGGMLASTNRIITVTANTLTLAGDIADGTNGLSGITKAGVNGTLVLSGANAYTGTTAVSRGTLIAGANAPSGGVGAFGNATSEISLGVASGNDAASILAGGAFTIGRNIRNNSTDVADAGTRVLTLGGNSAHDSVFSGNIFLGVASRPSKGIQLTAVAGGQVTFSGVIQNPSGQDVTEAAAAAALTAVTKVGLGTVVLSNANLYTGATTVSAGTLTVNGSLADASLSIASGAVVNGTGTLTFNINGITADQVVNGGTINVAGLTVAVIETGAGLDQAEYVLVDATGGGSISGAFVGVTGATGYALDYGTPNQVKLVQTGGGSPYDTWATSKGLTGLAGSSTDPAKDADPDKDGRNNLGEFAFNGNPTSGSDNGKVYMLTEDSDDGDAIKELILTVAVRTGTPAFAGSPSPSANQAADGITYSIEGSLDLASFPTTVNVVSPVITGLPADPGAGYEYRSFSLNGSNGLAGKGFLRAKVTSP